MKYTITINQAGIADAGYAGKTDITDWAIVEYIFSWHGSPKAIKREDFVWINYLHLAENMPLLGLNSKQAVSKRILKLAKLALLEVHHETDGRVFVRLSAACHAVINFREKKPEPGATVDHGQPQLTAPSTTVDTPVNHGGHSLGDHGLVDHGLGKDTRFRSPACPDGVSQSVWMDFQAVRKAKRSPVTETAMQAIRREAAKAGITLEQALTVCIERGWQGFRAEWHAAQGMHNSQAAQSNSAQVPSASSGDW